jgi:uncharacterized protein (TIGR02679 family)
LTAAGCDLRYHGDFDWDGLRIGASIIGRYGGSGWRFDADHYRAAVHRGGTALPGRTRVPETPWSTDLRGAMSEHGVAVYEEQVLDDLLGDLGT